MNYRIPVLAAAMAFAGCKATDKLPSTAVHMPASPTASEPTEYRASNTRLSDILHQQLRVSFDWTNRYLYGESTMDIRPYYYPSDRLFLNARGMQINEVALLHGDTKTPLRYVYENDSLKIDLDRTYARTDTFRIFIDYVSKPDELKDPEGSAAITSDKGLYFINPDGTVKNKPRQVWTQGETQASSAWFPTIDSPNERFTQEIYMTVDTALVTLSNGLLVSSIVNERQGTRTDYWRQNLPAAPYLTMMAAGDFRIVRDAWRSMDVTYFVDPEYERYARDIFGHTPEMIDFFSKRLGVDYPWEKYAQVVVHDYVSGAMENTSATLHGEFMQRDARALLDASNEDVVSHELFHQWFGDLVTCESWSNVPLNESFATYGEYLWNEYKYGREEADFYSLKDLEAYLDQAKSRNAPLIRFNYDEQEEVFDRITYQKGGRILHMLRTVLGDEAFFDGLKKYLTDNRFGSVEAHNLRLAMEAVSGRDLNWFFNQWFFAQGHPVLSITHEYIDSLKLVAVTVEQKQDFGDYPLFRLPMAIDIYTANGVKRHMVECRQAREVFLLPAATRPLLVNADAEKTLVCTKEDRKTDDEWIYQYRHAPLFLDRYEALQAVGRKYKAGTEAGRMVADAMKDPMWAIRQQAVKKIGPLAESEQEKESIRTALTGMAQKDPKAAVRAEAIQALARYFKDASLAAVCLSATKDSSYNVTGKALNTLMDVDSEKGIELAGRFEKDENEHLRKIVYGVYARNGSDDNAVFMTNEFTAMSGGEKYPGTLQYGEFLKRCRPSTLAKGIPLVAEVARNGEPWYLRMAGMQALTGLAEHCGREAADNKSDAALAGEYRKLKERIDREVKDIKDSETDSRLTRMYGHAGGD